MAEVVTKFGVTFTQHLTIPVFTTTDAHSLSVDDKISVTKTTEGTSGATDNITGVGTWDGETEDWVYNSGTEYTIATVPSDTTFTLTVEFNTIGDTSLRTIEYHPLEAAEEVVEEEEESSELQWEQFTLGQNKTIQDIAAAAAKASALIDANAKFAQATLETGKVLLMGILNPQLILLKAIADEIDNFVEDFKGTGFYILEVVPEGSETLPQDKEGNPIEILFSPIGLTAAYTASAAVGMADEWRDWFKIISGGEEDPKNPKKSSYYIEQGKTEAEKIRKANANDDLVSTTDDVFGFPKMTPSGVISKIVEAIDEEKDINRPNFSAGAEVAAVVVIIGFSDLTKNLIPLRNTLQAFIAFFGGENGLFTKGLFKILEIVKAGADNLAKGEDAYKVVIKVSNVVGARGTDPDDKEVLNMMGVDYNYEAVFEEGDLVVGPIRMFGGTAGKGRAMGIVTEVETTSNEPRFPLSSQTLTLTCLTDTDQHAFNNLGNGNVIQKVAYFKNQETKIDQNSGETIVGPEFNDYTYIKDLEFYGDGTVGQPTFERYEPYEEKYTSYLPRGGRGGGAVTSTRTKYKGPFHEHTEESKQMVAYKAQMKVAKEPNKVLLKVTDTPSVVEKHTPVGLFKLLEEDVQNAGPASRQYYERNWYGALQGKSLPQDHKTKNEVLGKIDKPKVKADNPGIPPNFKKAKLEDLLDDLKTFFFQISKFTQGMRDFAAGATEELGKVIAYLDEKIAEIEELNQSIQAILEIFQIGIPDAGVYVLSIPTTTGGNEAIKEALTSATNGPPNTLDYSVGFMMMGGGPSMKPLQLLLGVEYAGSAAIAAGEA